MSTPRPSWEAVLHNVIIGLTVSFVALSLGAAFGVLSGRGAFAGMIAAGIIAFITAALGGTRIQCSGPTAPMSAVSAIVVAHAFEHTFGDATTYDPNHFITTVFVMSGAIMCLMGILRLGRFITVVPNVVISGFMCGIAVLIWVGQAQKLFGIGDEPFGGPMLYNIMVAGLTLLIIVRMPLLLSRLAPRLAKYLPGTLIAIVAMTAVSAVLDLPIERVRIDTTIEGLSDLSALVAAQIPQEITTAMLLAALPFALQLAVLGFLDTLLTTLVIDKMSGERSRQNKELLGQGIANAASGLAGGIPGAQATIRSVLMIKEGATLRLAGIAVGVFVIIEMLMFQNLVSYIPQAVFAGVLLKVGHDVFDYQPFRLYLNQIVRGSPAMTRLVPRYPEERIFVSHMEMLLVLGTTVITVLYDLNVAVVGFTVAFYLLNRTVFVSRPIKDLKPILEGEGFADEP